MSRPLRSTVRCTWSIGSSPPSTKTKNCAGNRRAIPMTRRAPSFMSHVKPGTSRPERLTNSWNISEWWASSMTSWYAYRNSGELSGSLKAYSSNPRFRMLSNCRPAFMLATMARSPISARVSCGSDLYQSVAPSGLSSNSSQRGSCGSICISGASQSTSA